AATTELSTPPDIATTMRLACAARGRSNSAAASGIVRTGDIIARALHARGGQGQHRNLTAGKSRLYPLLTVAPLHGGHVRGKTTEFRRRAPVRRAAGGRLPAPAQLERSGRSTGGRARPACIAGRGPGRHRRQLRCPLRAP